MTAPRDLGLLQKCEEFLLHPTVRALSLAQRVDFLEKKGLSPEEITQCLKSVELRNGLSQLAQSTAHELTSVKPSKAETVAVGGSTSPLQLLQLVVKKYGLVTLLLALLGYGYTQFRRRKTQQLLLQHEADKAQLRRRSHMRVEALMAVVKGQQTQFNQAAELLNARVTKYLAAQQSPSKASASSSQFVKGIELQELQSELMELKSAVVETYLQPRVVNKVVEVTKEMPILLRPAEATVAERRAQGTKVVQDNKVESAKTIATSRKATKKQRQTATEVHQRESKVEKQNGVRDQTAMSPEEIAELFARSQVEEELSTAGSYRVLFATQ